MASPTTENGGDGNVLNDPKWFVLRLGEVKGKSLGNIR